MKNEIRFRRLTFHGKYKDVVPKWHVATSVTKWGAHVAVCGYQTLDILGDVQVSRAQKRPRRDQLCEKCVGRKP